MKYSKSGLACVVAGALTAVALSMAQDARADESSYVNTLAGYGVPVNEYVLPLGHAICFDIAHNGVAGVQHQADIAQDTGNDNYTTAAIIVTAVEELCPSNIPALDAWLAS